MHVYKSVRKVTTEKLRKKKGGLLCNLTFLCRCYYHKVIPNFLKHQLKTSKSKFILSKASLGLLQNENHITRSFLDSVCLQKVFLPFIQYRVVLLNKISRMLKKNHIISTFIPATKTSQLIRSPKDPINPVFYRGVYQISHNCVKVTLV